jgi:hypothetical protein
MGKVGSASRTNLVRLRAPEINQRRLWCTSTKEVHARATICGIGARVPGIDQWVVVHIYTMRMKLHITNIGAPVYAILKLGASVCAVPKSCHNKYWRTCVRNTKAWRICMRST